MELVRHRYAMIATLRSSNAVIGHHIDIGNRW